MQNVVPFSLFFLLTVPGAFGGMTTLALDDSSDIFAVAGGSHVLNATVTAGDFTTYNLFEIYHRNALNATEKLLVTMEDYNATLASVEHGYGIEVTDVNGMEKTISFTIFSLSFDDDGHIDFHLKSTGGATNQTESRSLTVVVTPTTVQIKFGSRSAVQSNSSTAIEVNSGNITVYCIVEESNPEITDISFTLNGNALTLASGPDSEVITAGVRKYTNNASAIVEVTSNTNGTQTLSCKAVDYLGGEHILQLLYELNSARKEQTTVLGLAVLLVISVLWNTL